jgi:uncharacterized protein
VAIRLQNEFTVNAPPEVTWPILLDLSRVSKCLPGATLEPEGGDAYRGTMKVKLGPILTEYTGTATLEEADESSHTAKVRISGKETRGQGTANALIENRLHAESGSTRVVVETEVNVTGRPAQFGRGIMQGVAGKLLDEFAVRLEEEIASSGSAAAERPSEPAAPEALDLGGAARNAFGRRAAAVAGAAGLALLALRALRRRR